MDWLFDNLQIVFIAIIAIVSLAKKALDAKRETTASPPPPVPEEYDDEEWHETNPPQYEYLPTVPPPLPAAVAVEEESSVLLKRQAEIRERLRAAKQAKAAQIKNASAAKKKPSTVSPSSPLRDSLRTRGELRRAFVLKEILDPPIGLK